MIREAAVEAAAEELWDRRREVSQWADLGGDIKDLIRKDVRRTLEAAAPHMLAQAWESGANAAWERSTPIVNGQNYQWRYSGDPINPYRSGE